VLVAIGAALVLLGCANVANVLMLRAVRTERDRSIRLALGASRARLAALQLSESAVLAVAGAVLGVLLAIWLKSLIAWLLFPGVPADAFLDWGAPLDYRVLGMTVAVSLGCGLGAGFLPAVLARTSAVFGSAASAGGRTITATRWLRGTLAATQLALSLALVTGSLLLIATLKHLNAVDLGFEPAGASRHLIDPTQHGYSAERATAYLDQLFTKLDANPAFEAVALSGLSPFGSSWRVRLQDPAGADRPPVSVYSNNVSSRYFDVLRTRLVKGRPFSEAEARMPATANYPVIVDESLARRLFGSADPIGQFVTIPAAGSDPAIRALVIGVAADVHWNNILGDQPLFLYQPLSTFNRVSMVLVRSGLPTAEVTRIVRSAAFEIDPTLPVRFSQPLGALVEQKVREQRLLAWMLSLLGWLAFALAAVGLYGLLAQSVVERTREFGVRMALGSGGGRIFGLVIRQAGWISLVGVTAGLTLAGFGSRVIGSQLYGVTPVEPLIYAQAALFLVIVVFAAALWPARAATRIQPVEALRAE
jgi:predicted permease